MSTGFETGSARQPVDRRRCSLLAIAACACLTGMAFAQPPPAGERLRDCTICPEIVVIPEGTFQMGSPPDERERSNDEGPQQRITIGAFAVGRAEVTFAEWDACV